MNAASLTASGTVSGAGFVSLLSPYALQTSVPLNYYTVSPLLAQLQLSGANVGKMQLSFDSSQPLTCYGFTSNRGLNVA